MNNLNLSPEKLEMLLNLVGQKTGASPDQLRQQLEQGNFNDTIGKMNPQQGQMLNSLLSNPKMLEQLLNTPKAQQLLRTLMGGK